MTTIEEKHLPEWLRPLAEILASVDAEHLAPRFPHPPSEARPAGVLMLFGDGDRGPELLLTQRATTLRNHAGQISFPGGRQDDADVDVIHTALRESKEEVGLDDGEVKVLGTLPPLWLPPPSNHAVTTVLGHWRTPRLLVPHSPAEVQEVLRTPIDMLLDPSRRFTIVHPESGWRGPAFDIGTDVPLWGFTAGIVSRLFKKVGWERPWDDSLERPVPEVHS